MRILANREGLLDAFAGVSSVVPARSPKPIIQNVMLIAGPDDGPVLMGTDLEVGIRRQVAGVEVDRPGSVVMPTAQIGAILRAGGDEELSIHVDDDRLTVRGLHAEFKLLTEDASLFPEVPDFAANDYHVIAAADLKRLIRRTSFATDPESTRYALGGVLVELADDSIAMVGTDGRRLARMSAPAEVEGKPAAPAGTPVIPVKALKLIERNLDDEDPPVHVAIQSGTAVLVRTATAVIFSRLVEGRFPRYQDVFPSEASVTIELSAGGIRAAITQAAITTSEESRGVDFAFGKGVLELTSKTSIVGDSRVEMPIAYDGPPIKISFLPQYILEMLRTIDAVETVSISLVDHKSAAVFRVEGYDYVVMPLTLSQ